MQTKILITGGNGQLGRCLRESLSCELPDAVVVSTDVDTLDVLKPDDVEAMLANGNFTYIVNCVAYTAVDRAENDFEAASALNTRVPAILGHAAVRNNVKIIHISTDYVFPGTGTSPLKENDLTGPATVYGATKLAGEEALMEATSGDAIIIRTSWLYAATSPSNFVKTMLRLGLAGNQIRVVADQHGSPTNAEDLAHAITAIIASGRWDAGVYHYANGGVSTWYDLAKEALRLAGIESNITPITTDQYPTAAKRPSYSALCLDKISSTYPEATIYEWRESLGRCIDKIKQLNNKNS